MQRTQRHARGRAGYSLVELMVAMTAGSILLSSGYILVQSSSQHFHRSSRVATTQASVRMAAEQLRGDIARAGFLGHPSLTSTDDHCGGEPVANGITSPDGSASTLSSVDFATSVPASAPVTNQVRHDRLTLTGNYMTNERYDMLPAISNGQMRINPQDPAFQRSFVDVSGTVYDNNAFLTAFAPGRLARVDMFSPTRTFYRVVAASNAGTLSSAAGQPVTWTAGAEPTVTFALPSACIEDLSNMENAFIAPVTTVDYQVVAPSSNAAAFGNLSLSTADGAAMEWLLTRREWDYLGGDFFAGRERIVLEYALEFGLTALACPGGAGTCGLMDLNLDTALTTVPANVQGLRVTMAARTAEADRSFDPNGAFDRGAVPTSTPLRSWAPLVAAGPGRARVRSTTFDVALMNNQP